MKLAWAFNIPLAALFDYRQQLSSNVLILGYIDCSEKELNILLGERIGQLREMRQITYLDIDWKMPSIKKKPSNMRRVKK